MWFIFIFLSAKLPAFVDLQDTLHDCFPDSERKRMMLQVSILKYLDRFFFPFSEQVFYYFDIVKMIKLFFANQCLSYQKKYL